MENIKVKLEDRGEVLLLLNEFPNTFEHFKDALLFWKKYAIMLEEVLTSILITKELQKLQASKANNCVLSSNASISITTNVLSVLTTTRSITFRSFVNKRRKIKKFHF